jgi:hypothetical protein
MSLNQQTDKSEYLPKNIPPGPGRDILGAAETQSCSGHLHLPQASQAYRCKTPAGEKCGFESNCSMPFVWCCSNTRIPKELVFSNFTNFEQKWENGTFVLFSFYLLLVYLSFDRWWWWWGGLRE